MQRLPATITLIEASSLLERHSLIEPTSVIEAVDRTGRSSQLYDEFANAATEHTEFAWDLLPAEEGLRGKRSRDLDHIPPVLGDPSV